MTRRVQRCPRGSASGWRPPASRSRATSTVPGSRATTGSAGRRRDGSSRRASRSTSGTAIPTTSTRRSRPAVTASASPSNGPAASRTPTAGTKRRSTATAPSCAACHERGLEPLVTLAPLHPSVVARRGVLAEPGRAGALRGLGGPGGGRDRSARHELGDDQRAEHLRAADVPPRHVPARRPPGLRQDRPSARPPPDRPRPRLRRDPRPPARGQGCDEHVLVLGLRDRPVAERRPPRPAARHRPR